MDHPPLPSPHDIVIARTTRRGRRREQVAEALKDQVGQLGSGLREDLETKVLGRLVDDRQRRDDRQTIQVLDGQRSPVLAASGQVLARAGDLSANELKRAERIEGLDGVVVISGEDPADLSDAKYRPNYVTPMGVVVKAMCGPEPVKDAPPERLPSGPGTPTRVAVIDTGINVDDRDDHWLEGLQTELNIDPLYPEPTPSRILGLGAGHGTFVSGIVQQLAPDAELRVYNALQEDGLGTEVDVATAVLDAYWWGADVINLSLGLETIDDQPPYALEAVVNLINAGWREVLVIAAAGNTGRDRPCWPGALNGVVAVAGLTVDEQPAEWSTRGPWVDCSTIAEGIVSTYVEGKEDVLVDRKKPDVFGHNPWALWSGTSYAAPQVTGAVAQLAQRDGISSRRALQRLLADGQPHPHYGRMIKLLTPGDLEEPVQFVPIPERGRRSE